RDATAHDAADDSSDDPTAHDAADDSPDRSPGSRDDGAYRCSQRGTALGSCDPSGQGPRRIDATVDCGTRRPLAGAEARVARVLVPAVDAREDAGEHVTCRSQPLSCGLESVGTLQPRDNRFLATLGEDSPGVLQHLVTAVTR